PQFLLLGSLEDHQVEQAHLAKFELARMGIVQAKNFLILTHIERATAGGINTRAKKMPASLSPVKVRKVLLNKGNLKVPRPDRRFRNWLVFGYAGKIVRFAKIQLPA